METDVAYSVELVSFATDHLGLLLTNLFVMRSWKLPLSTRSMLFAIQETLLYFTSFVVYLIRPAQLVDSTCGGVVHCHGEFLFSINRGSIGKQGGYW